MDTFENISSVADAIAGQARDFIEHSKDSEIATEYLAVMAINGCIKMNDLNDTRHLKEFHDLAKKMLLVKGDLTVSPSTQEYLKVFLSSEYKEIYDRVEKRLEGRESLRDVHARAIRFLDMDQTKKDERDPFKEADNISSHYLAILAVKGEVQASDLKNVKILSFMKLNKRAIEDGLGYPGYLPNNKMQVSEKTKIALRRFFEEGNVQGRYSDKFKQGLLEVYNEERINCAERALSR